MPTLPSLATRTLRFLDTLSWLPPLLLRVLVGTAFVLTGWGKLHNLENVTKYFDSLGIPAASLQAPMVSAIEFVGGLLLVVGLATRVVAALLIGVMAVALLTAIIPGADGAGAIISSIEATYLFIFVYLAVRGAGPASLDQKIWRSPS